MDMGEVMSKVINELDDFYKNHKRIQIPICGYQDDDGTYVFDVEVMAEEFENEMSKLTNSTVMCTILEEDE